MPGGSLCFEAWPSTTMELLISDLRVLYPHPLVSLVPSSLSPRLFWRCYACCSLRGRERRDADAPKPVSLFPYLPARAFTTVGNIQSTINRYHTNVIDR